MPERRALLVTLSFLVWLGLVPIGDWWRLATFGAILCATALTLKKNPLRLAFKGLCVTPFTLAALPLLFTVAGPTVAHLGPWPISQPGSARFFTILLRAWLGVQATFLLMSCLGSRGVLQALTDLRLPPMLLSIVALMLRYVEVLQAEVQRMNRARLARSAGRAGAPWYWHAYVTGQLAGSLFARSLDRGERVYLAMKSRGYDGRERRLEPVPAASISDWLGLGLVNLGLAAVALSW